MRKELEAKLADMAEAVEARNRLMAAWVELDRAWRACIDAGQACSSSLEHGEAEAFFRDMREDADAWSDKVFADVDNVDAAMTQMVQDGAEAVEGALAAGELAEFADRWPGVYAYAPSATRSPARARVLDFNSGLPVKEVRSNG